MLFLSVEEICKHIVGTPAPLFFVDTCVFLDILRSPFRDTISTEGITSALKLIKMSENNPPQAWLTTNETVYGEWNNNIDIIKLELEKEIKKLEIKREKLLLAAKLALGQTYEYGQKVTSIKLHNHLESLSRNFLDNCLIAQVEDVHSVKAMHRVRKFFAPARKGKQEAKDCEILEAFLDLSQKVRNTGFREVICFISSNVDDYGKPGKSPIQHEFEEIGAKYVNNLQWALAVAEGRT